MTARTTETKHLNDAFRRDLFNPALGDLILTPGVAFLPDDKQMGLLDEVRCFEDFAEDNEQHDCGQIRFSGETYCWKIDCLPVANLTRRVLTVMQAREA